MSKHQSFTDSYGETLAIDKQPAPGQQRGGVPGVPFPGIGRPSTDMQAVRDGRRSTLQGYLVDLSTARSFAAGTALLLDVQGNVFFADPLFDLSGNSQAGIARVHFQDQNSNPVGTYVTALPSALYKVPFTRLAVENYAQAGKFLYIVYGTDVDILPGASQQVQATILNSTLGIRSTGQNYAASFISNTVLGIGGTEQIFNAASNPNGAILHRLQGFGQNGTNITYCSLVAHTVAPAVITDGATIAQDESRVAIGTQFLGHMKLETPILIPAGKGLWFFNSSGVAETSCRRAALYTLL